MIHDIEISPAAEGLLAAGIVQHIGLYIHVPSDLGNQAEAGGAVYHTGLDKIMFGEHVLRQVAL